MNKIDPQKVLDRADEIMSRDHGMPIRSRQVRAAIEAVVEAINQATGNDRYRDPTTFPNLFKALP